MALKLYVPQNRPLMGLQQALPILSNPCWRLCWFRVALNEVRVSELATASGPRARPGWWSLIGGIGLATLGHVLAIAAMKIPAEKYGASSPDEDLDAGGRFAALFSVLFTYGFVHTLLLVAGIIFILSRYGAQRFKRGLIAGWAGGWALILGTVVVFVLAGS
ncbi:hypothetical protein [Micromonospora sp. NPDC050200]|uniref:hypothetical protein n=1 Tax=Micromonospora sp. NPDC050200 TaxID=3155664 RepID=UPI0033F27560